MGLAGFNFPFNQSVDIKADFVGTYIASLPRARWGYWKMPPRNPQCLAAIFYISFAIPWFQKNNGGFLNFMGGLPPVILPFLQCSSCRGSQVMMIYLDVTH